jgi:hypothetical protein
LQPTNAGAATAAYVAFDFLKLKGKDVRRQSIEDQRAELQRIVKGADAILFSEAIAAERELVFAEARTPVFRRDRRLRCLPECRKWADIERSPNGR